MTTDNNDNNPLPDELLNARIAFGLVAQGHIPIIERMLAEGHDWDAISNAIHWMPSTAREYYERYAQLQRNPVDEVDVVVKPVLAKAVEVLRKARPKLEVWDRNEISSIIREAEENLLSTPKKRQP